jgi:hypothetical protein
VELDAAEQVIVTADFEAPRGDYEPEVEARYPPG